MYKRFLELYKDEKINDAKDEDKIYAVAHAQFMTNVDVIEKENPHITDNDEDSDYAWYDEYHVDVVWEYMKRLRKYNKV